MNNSIKIRPIDNSQLSDKTKRAVIDIILQNAVDGKPFKLPNEDELSQRLGVSRNVLRDVLISMEQIGYLTRRRSKGTIANPKIVTATCRLDIEPELLSNLVSSGYVARAETQNLGFVFEKDEVFGPEEECYLSVEKIFYADDIPVAYGIDRIAGKYTKHIGNAILQLRDMSHYRFLQQYCNTEMAYSLSHIDVSLPEPWLMESLCLSENEPVIIIEDEGYNYDHEIVVHSHVYYKRGILDLKFLRKSWQS